MDNTTKIFELAHSPSLSISIYKDPSTKYAIIIYRDPKTDSTTSSSVPITLINLLKIFGMEYSLVDSTYVLTRETYSASDVLKINRNILATYNESNKKGFVPFDWPHNHVCLEVEKHLEGLGYELGSKRVGTNQNTFLL